MAGEKVAISSTGRPGAVIAVKLIKLMEHHEFENDKAAFPHCLVAADGRSLVKQAVNLIIMDLKSATYRGSNICFPGVYGKVFKIDQIKNVPKFGNWTSGDQVPYTVCFEKARRRRGGPLVNPNDPRENPSAFGEEPQVPNRGTPKEQFENPGALVADPALAHVSKQDPPRAAEELRKPTAFAGQLDRGGFTSSDQAKPVKRENGGAERTAGYASPQPYYEERVYRRDGASERKNSTDGGQRLKNRSAVRTENVGTGPAIPKFGDWNEADPSAAVGYTGIFDQVREGKLGAAVGRPPAIRVETPVRYPPRQNARKSWIRRCFGM